MKKNLIIDFCGKENGKIWLLTNDKPDLLWESKETDYRNENLLANFVTVLKNENISLDQIVKIFVCAGAGSYISSRIVAVIFNIISDNKKISLAQFSHDDGYEKAQLVKNITPIYKSNLSLK